LSRIWSGWRSSLVIVKPETVSVSRRDRCKLVLSAKDRVEIVRRIFATYVQDKCGFKAIADALKAQ